jgi:hypothetical protein
MLSRAKIHSLRRCGVVWCESHKAASVCFPHRDTRPVSDGARPSARFHASILRSKDSESATTLYSYEQFTAGRRGDEVVCGLK